MNVSEIKQAVLAGQTVCWKQSNYRVIKDRNDQWLIECTNNGHCIGLTWQDGTTLNGNEGEFYVLEDKQTAAAKTLIVSGTVKKTANNRLQYDLMLYGQTPQHPLCVFIGPLMTSVNVYSEIIDLCKQKYAAYFMVDEFNIVTLDNIIMLQS